MCILFEHNSCLLQTAYYSKVQRQVLTTIQLKKLMFVTIQILYKYMAE